MRIGLALGGGGARGLAHIAILEALDELGIKPAMIAGTSIGALIGAAYASGMRASDIRDYCKAAFARRSALLRHLYFRWRGRVWDY
ncbi:MAG: patatin-like phospholipase family protein, partial [Rhodomicrobium sp.]